MTLIVLLELRGVDLNSYVLKTEDSSLLPLQLPRCSGEVTSAPAIDDPEETARATEVDRAMPHDLAEVIAQS
jgi:hypothetical protein